ncbi:hypothetical protein [Lacticaseibacillus rhamnosus]|uniref:hypothetical protein n=1 Tax=Lacticaseibacillus rhamnosus TaxID=47715 RepID=UPI00237FD5FE|nr:hypothetical protein [Lacticaseibacillus rhamnosus]MDE3295893.1 hypothetical protein [Lacticaseibacillus rhamnosus]
MENTTVAAASGLFNMPALEAWYNATGLGSAALLQAVKRWQAEQRHALYFSNGKPHKRLTREQVAALNTLVDFYTRYFRML